MAKYDLPQERLDLLIARFPKFKKQITEKRDNFLKEANGNAKLLDINEAKIVFNFLPTIMALNVDLIEVSDLEKNKIQDELKVIHKRIINVLREFSDLKEEHYILVATWIIGTYLHDSFPSYPYLFLNAMRGSGKTRLLKLIASMSCGGKVLLSPTEAVMFRMPKGKTLCLDEMEGIGRKENGGVREMLNACYKKGSTVNRMKQIKHPDGSSEQVIEEFEPYKPLCLANIWGIEEVLSDRCVTIILEKSQRQDIMKIIEDFESNLNIKLIKSSLNTILVQLCSYVDVMGGIERWNMYVKKVYTTPTTHNTLTTLTTQTTPQLEDLFKRIDNTGINGRNLELFFPLMMMAYNISEEVLEEILETAMILNKEKRKEELTESKDVSVYDFISKLPGADFRSIKTLTIAFRNFLGNIEDADDKWINERWFGKAIKRLNLIVDKRRMAHGNEVILNIDKARNQIEGFK